MDHLIVDFKIKLLNGLVIVLKMFDIKSPYYWLIFFEATTISSTWI